MGKLAPVGNGQLLRIGVADAGICHVSGEPVATIADKFAMARDAEAFDYIEATPPRDQVAEYARCAQVYDLPVLAGSRNYILGLQEPELAENLRIGADLGSLVHNTQVFMDHADGHLVTNDEVMKCYLDAYEIGAKIGCIPCFETHVNMWSEQFGRVREVAAMVRARGVPFNITLDHSHIIFKLDNPVELAVFDVAGHLAAGDFSLDPSSPGNEIQLWIDAGLVAHAHARAAVPNNPKNMWARHPDIHQLRSSLHPKSTVGRGIQYPFIEPEPGQWHSSWHAEAMAPWKLVVEQLLRHQVNHPSSSLRTYTTEYIPFTDYGEGSLYSLLENNAACARWLRATWQSLCEEKSTPIAE